MIVIPTIAVLLTCHNRKDKTLHCMQALYAQQGLNVDYVVDVFLVDDASSDGTAEAVQFQFPDVNVICGTGNLYWNRGMHLAWKTATSKKDYDYYLWLNDDTFLHQTALKTLLSKSFETAIICGSTHSIIENKATYGGYLTNPVRRVVPNGTYQKCDYFNGNCVLISKKVFEIMGNLDPIFHHAVGDFDYGLRAKKKGVELYVAPNFVGICENHDFVPKWRSPEQSVSTRLKSLYLPNSGCYPPQFFIFDSRHNGVFQACLHYFTIHLRAIMPSLWKAK